MGQPDIGSIRDLVCYRIETAKNDLKVAVMLLSEKEYRAANNRAYYAIFHAILAIHALDGRTYKRHKDALANFDCINIFDEAFHLQIPVPYAPHCPDFLWIFRIFLNFLAQPLYMDSQRLLFRITVAAPDCVKQVLF